MSCQRAECPRSLPRTREGTQGRFRNTPADWESFSNIIKSLLSVYSALRAGAARERNKGQVSDLTEPMALQRRGGKGRGDEE